MLSRQNWIQCSCDRFKKNPSYGPQETAPSFLFETSPISFTVSYSRVYRMPNGYRCSALVLAGLFAVLGNFGIIHTIIARS